jgi:exopolyphosphatase/guanosine-5'-triphosphate,3'-diphosphate pyrophosphatase
MKLASLDLGTNSFLLLIANYDQKNQFKVLRDEMRIVRLGQDLAQSGRLHPEALARARTCLQEFSDIIHEEKVEMVRAVATAAAREAQNAGDFFKICQDFKIPIEIISGDEEAKMSFQGAIPSGEKRKVLLIDIGGGSTEYIVGTPAVTHFSLSLPYGALKLTEMFIHKQPVSPSEEKSLRNYIAQQTEKTWRDIGGLRPEKIVAVAGTPTSLAAAILGGFDQKRIDGLSIDRETLGEWVAKLRNSSVEEKKNLYGFGARAEIIFAGIVILDELLTALRMDSLEVSTKGIRYGLAYKMASHLQRHLLD